MSYEVNWHVPRRVLLFTYQDRVELDDLEAMSDDLNTLLDDGEAPVHLLTDARLLDSMPTHIGQIRDTLSVFNRSEWGWIVLIGSNPLIGFLLTMISQAFSISVKTAATLEEAEQILQRVDASLTRIE